MPAPWCAALLPFPSLPPRHACTRLPPSPSLPPVQLGLGKDLGAGTFGSVREAFLPNGRAVAIKMPRGTEDRRGALRVLCTEVRGLRLVRDMQHVLPLQGLVMQDGEWVAMLTPLCNAGTLADIAK